MNASLETMGQANLKADNDPAQDLVTGDTGFRRFFKKYRLLLIALSGSLLFHGPLLLFGSYKGTYDAYVHIFFADHYRRSWWQLWETRWYTGFTMVSYPPLTHQLTALIAKVISLPAGFVIVMLFASLMSTLGIYRFSRLWVGPRPAAYAALLAVVSSSIAETVHLFGQLPTMFVIGIMLNALPYVWYWIEDGQWRQLFRGWAILMVAAAGHHVTTLFGMVFFSGPIIATILLKKFHTPRKEEPEHAERVTLRTLWGLVTNRVKRVSPATVRAGIFGVGLIIVLVTTVLPYWLWSRSDPITQISIPHASRDSFLENQAAGLIFFVVPWGVLILTLPYAFYKGFGTKNWILATSLAGMVVLGTGGTTPIPAMLLRGAFYILTLDRFTFWATIIILPLSGQFVESLLHGRLGAWIGARLGTWFRDGFAITLAVLMVVWAFYTANLTKYRKFQPPSIDAGPIVEFLAKDNHDSWRYMTLGFGDQMAWVGAQTTALNVEGNYHSARRLPEMTSTPVERMDGAKYTAIPGLGSLTQFVTNPQRYNLKYIFVNDAFYEPLLYFSGWHRLGTLDNDIDVWERQDVPPLPVVIPQQPYPAWQRLMWGGLPVGSIFVTAAAFFLTTLVIPRFKLTPQRIPIVRRVVRWRLVKNWLLDNPVEGFEGSSEEWQLWKRFVRRFFPGMRLEPLAQRTAYGIGATTVIFAIVIAGVFITREAQITPEAVLLAYYDDVDFQRFSDSYQYLETDLTRDEYLRWLSLRGGILASFAKMDDILMDVRRIDDSHVQADMTINYVTALGEYTQTFTRDLVATPQGWRIVLDVEPPPVPRESFVASSDAGWYLNLPLSTLDQSALTRGSLDRAALSVHSTRVVYVPDVLISFEPTTAPDLGREGRFRGLVSIIGEVTNMDAFPAQITVNAIFRDADGNRLDQVNAKDVMVHQLLPGETTPFRLDLFGARAAEIMDMSVIASVELNVQAAPTSYNLSRQLLLLRRGLLYNSGVEIVDIPHVLVSFYDVEGLLWVDGVYVSEAIAPDKTAEFEDPPLPEGLEVLDIPVTLNGPVLVPWSQPVDVSTGLKYTVHGYTR